MRLRWGKTARSSQEQATASWINYLNQVRLDRLSQELNAQNTNWERAAETLKKAGKIIEKEIVERDRGGVKGMHGYIAEVAEYGIGNAREQLEGRMPVYEWINDNGPVDLMRNGVPIQQKFSASGGHLSLYAIHQHMDKYPDFLREGGKYQIPADHYEKIKYLLSVPKEQAEKMPTSNGEFSLKQWREVHRFFDRGDVRLKDLEPSKLDYHQVQREQYKTTLRDERQSLRERDREIRKEAYDASKPTVREGAQAAAVSAAIEGGVTLVAVIGKKRQSGRKISEFTTQDWEDILKETGVGTVKGGIRGVSIYVLTNYTATPAAVASSLCTASFGMAQQAHLYRQGKITQEQFLRNSEMLCLETSVSALSSFAGQALIPIPVLGAVIGNTVGMTMYQIAEDTLSRREQKVIADYLKELKELDRRLDQQYRRCIEDLNEGLRQYYTLLERAFSPNYAEALEGSVALAMSLGVPSEKLLKSIDEIDDFFLN